MTTNSRVAAKPNIGLTDDQRVGVCEILNGRLADEVVLYTKTRKYHWNVTGMHFSELHEFFQEQYTILEAAIDEVAERVRQLGFMAIGTLDEFKTLSKIKEKPGHNPGAVEMIRDLLHDHETVITQLRQDIDTTADKYHDMGTSDFLTAQLETHEKMAWMLRAHLEGE
ncbi:MAG: DNA starvation/stationary phase protection protein [Anaerolineae bacterium]|nr:DNA starvation/stationary phase protection protein [Anaerolineae bacterium]